MSGPSHSEDHIPDCPKHDILNYIAEKGWDSPTIPSSYNFLLCKTVILDGLDQIAVILFFPCRKAKKN